MVMNCISNGNDTIIHSKVGLIKMTLHKMSQYLPKLFRSFGGNINVKVDLSNYSIKTDLICSKNGPAHLSKLRHIFKNNVAKKTVYDKLSAKANNIDTSSFVLKTKYQTDKTELEKKNPDGTDLVNNTKLTEIENKIPDISTLATKTALTTVENKIPDVSSLVKKTNYDKKN